MLNNLNKKAGLIAMLAGMAASQLTAQTLTNYTAGGGDVLVCFRQSGGGAKNLVVDAGNISTLTGLSANARYAISSYTGTQLGQIGTNNILWSAFTWQTGNTLYMTKLRSSLNTQSSPYQVQNSGTQSGAASYMASIPPGAADEFGDGPYQAYCSSAAVVEESSGSGNPNYVDGDSYYDAVGGANSGTTSGGVPYGANFNNTFSGDPENLTPSSFTVSGKVERSDFYKLTPSSGYALAAYLGYFELSTNGAMTYVAYPSATPVIKSISRSGNVTTITYTTGLYGTYTLRSTPSLPAASAEISWTSVATLTSGDTSVHTYYDTDSSSKKFYAITAQ